MVFKDVLNNFKKDIGLCYQSQKNVVDVSQRYINELEKAYEGGGSGGGGINYSEIEQDTGRKWIDGKKVYQITKNINTAVSAADQWVNTSLTIPGIKDIIMAYANSGASTISVMVTTESNGTIKILRHTTRGNAVISNLTVLYTKSS